MIAATLLTASAAAADVPIIKHVNATLSNGLWDFDVTISHTDTGWDDYADAWRIIDSDGKELGLRQLAHPHIEEQPFTRSLSGIRIPASITEVEIQVHDVVNGWTLPGKRVPLTRR